MSAHAFLWLTSYVVNSVWQVAALALAGWCLSRLMKPAGPELQHKIWVATLMLAAVVPVTPLIQHYFAQATARQARPFPTALIPQMFAQHISLTASDLVLQPPALYLISATYIAFLLFCFARLCWVLRRTAELVRRSDDAPIEPDYAELWNTSKDRFSVQPAILLQSREASGPMTTGLSRPVLILPVWFREEYSRADFQAAVAHECAHIKRDDFRKNLFYEFVGLFTAFHPLTWFIKSQIAQTREMVCDQMAADQLPDRRAYAHSLLQLAATMKAATPAGSNAMGMFDSGILETRIRSLTVPAPVLSRIQRHLRTLIATILLPMCALGIGLMTRRVAAQAAAKMQPGPDLACTYYAVMTVGHDGTCGYDKNDHTKYRCYLSSDMALSEPQIGCEWKLRRAEQSRK